MGFLDEAKNLADEHSKQVNEGIEKGGDLVDERTGDKYTYEVDKGEDLLDKQLGIPEDEQGTGAKGGPADSGHVSRPTT
jgi:hypothetical protein